MSSDQITYVLVALIVTGVAILLLLAGALVARRGRGSGTRSGFVASEPPAPAVAAPVAPFTAAPPPMPAPVPVAAPPVAAPVAAAVAEAAPPFAAVDATTAPPHAPADEGEHPAEEAGVTPADLEAAARRVHDPRDEEVIKGFLSIPPRRRESAAFESPRAPSVTARSAEPAAPGADATPADPYVDEATGLDSRAAWDRALDEENARYVRYRRPVGVVIAELDGLGRFEGEFGPDAARRILAAVGGAMRRGARRTDRVAHGGGGRFLVLLPETDEIQAINYVERVRSECDRWLAAGAVALHLSIGWASPSAVGELDTALRTAEERMYAERRRAARTGVGDADGPR